MKLRRARRKKRNAKDVRPREFDLMHSFPMLGMDEVGTGSAAGPIAAGGVVLSKSSEVLDLLESLSLRDSKKMSTHGREEASRIIRETSPFCEVIYVEPRMLERLGQGPALNWMFNRLIERFRRMYGSTGSVVLDGDRRALDYFHVAVRQGDQKSFTISAASVVAKVARDNLMIEYARDFPGYALEDNKGYLTAAHRKGLSRHGVAEIHRRNVRPIQKALEISGELNTWAMH